jgi:hypothetical protein
MMAASWDLKATPTCGFDHQLAAGHALAHVVVGIAREDHLRPPAFHTPKLWPAVPLKCDLDRMAAMPWLPWRLTISPDRRAPTERSVLRMS